MNNIKFHYEVESEYHHDSKQFKIIKFEGEDLLQTREATFNYGKEILNQLFKNDEIDFDLTNCSVRESAQIRHEKKVQKDLSDLLYLHSAYTTFKNSAWQYGLKIFLVIDHDFEISSYSFNRNQRILIYQIGNITKNTFVEQLEGLVKEFWIYCFKGLSLKEHHETIDLTPFWHIVDQEELKTPEQIILKTPINVHRSFWENEYSLFNNQIYDEKIVDQVFNENLDLEFDTIHSLDFIEINRMIDSFYYTKDGYIKLYIRTMSTYEETYKLILALKNKINNNHHNYNLQMTIIQNDKNQFKLGIYVQSLKINERNTQLITHYPDVLHYREFGEIKTLTLFDQIYQYINQKLNDEED